MLEQADLRELAGDVCTRTLATRVDGRKVDDAGRDADDAGPRFAGWEERVQRGEEATHVGLYSVSGGV